MKISCDGIYQTTLSCISPLARPVRWCYRHWENLNIPPKIGCCGHLKVIGVSAVLLGLVVIAFRRYNAKLPADSEKQPPTTDSTFKVTSNEQPTAACVSYDNSAWDELSGRIAITEEDVQSFRNYQKNETIEEAYAENVKFFYGNCDDGLSGGHKDIGFGCAWRSIQTCLSPSSIFHTFQSLFHKYKREPNNPREWAEPGYGKIICDDEKIASMLYLYNRTNGTNKTPTKDCIRLESFADLIEKMFSHFQEFKTPIMVDDSVLTCSILGIKSTSDGINKHIILWVADPHKNSREDGLYFLVLDSLTGEKIECTGLDISTNGYASAQQIYPDKKWMLLFPQVKK